jgi:hypothetical protein
MTPREALNRLLASKELYAYEARLRRVTAFHILGIEGREVSHAALLAWILDPRASHGIGSEPLRRFLLLVASRSDTSVLDAIEVEAFDLDDAIVETEIPIEVPAAGGDGSAIKRRLDIVVSLSLASQAEPSPIAVIEYKVDANEGDEQTSDYARWCATRTVPSKRGDVLPLQAFVSPVVDEDARPAAPFVPIGYDEYLAWIDDVRALSMTDQARFLLNEWRDCIAVRDDVRENEQAALADAIRAAHTDAVEVLRSARTELEPWDDVLRLHEDAFTRLEILSARNAKGHSAAVVSMREALTKKLDESLWGVSEGVGSLRCVFLPSVDAVAACVGERRLSGLHVQVFAERPKEARFGVVLEVIGEVIGLDAKAARALRIKLAESLRAQLRQVDADAPFRPGATATVLRFRIAMPGVTDLATDTDANAKAHATEMEAVADRLRRMEASLTAWAGGPLRSMLSDALGGPSGPPR